MKNLRRSGLRRRFFVSAVGQKDRQRCISYFSTDPYYGWDSCSFCCGIVCCRNDGNSGCWLSIIYNLILIYKAAYKIPIEAVNEVYEKVRRGVL